MKIDTLVLGNLGTNCYIISNEKKEAIIIDPADNASIIIDACKDYNVTSILVTHHHFDHIGALNEIEQYYNLNHNTFNDNFGYEIIKTPGHTDDLLSFYFKNEKWLFCGDFIFLNSIGRFDFENSSQKDMQKSLELISKYPDEIKVFPGHGPSTILGNEKRRFKYYF